MIERVQAKMAPMLPTTRIVPKLRQEISTVLTYGDLHTDVKTKKRARTLQLRYKLRILDYIASTDYAGGGKTPAHRSKKTEKQLHQPCQCISHPDRLPAPDRTTLWAQMQEYHSSSRKWHFNNEQSRTDDGSPLIWTMVHTSSAA